jgi:hypothetical protein
VVGACAPAPASKGSAEPVYSKTTGKLEQLIADADADGKPDLRAIMDGATLKRIEVDRDHDGRPDRWEEYVTAADKDAEPGPQIVRAEEANGPDDRVTRREQYEGGQLRTVEEDTDLDGRVDKWETYKDNRLLTVDLDLEGTGSPNRRLSYGPSGEVTSSPVPPSPQ